MPSTIAATSRTRVFAVIVLVVLVFAFAWTSVTMAPRDSPVSIWWPAGGVAVLAMLLAPPRWTWPLAVVLTLETAVANAIGGRTWDVALAFGVGNTVETLVVALLLRRRAVDFRIRTLDDFWALCRAIVAAVVTSSALFAITVAALGDDDPLRTFLTTLPSHASAILLIVPLGLTWLTRRRNRTSTTELVLQAVLLAAVTALVLLALSDHPVTFVILPVLAWVAMRAPLHLVTIELYLVAAAILTGTQAGHSPFLIDNGHEDYAPLVAEAFAIAIVLATLPLALAQQQQARAMRVLRERESALLEETRFSRALLDIAADLVLVLRRDGVILQVTRGLEELLAIDPARFEGRAVWEALFPPDAHEQGPERWERIRAAGPASPGAEVDLQHTDGSLRRAVLRTAPLPGRHEGQERFVVIGVDVTRERNAAGLLGHVLGSPSATAMIGTDLDGTVTLFNRGAETLLSVDAAAVTGRPVADLVLEGPAPGEASFEDLVSSVEHHEQPETSDWQWHGASRPVLMSTTVSEIRDAFGRRVGYLLVGHDVTAERLAAERQHRLDQAKNEFVWTTSHEIRTPITSIVGYTELLTDGAFGPLDECQLEAVTAIDRNAVRLRELADNVLALGGADARAVDPHVHEDDGPVDLAACVRVAAADLAAQAAAAGVDLRVDVADEPVRVAGTTEDLQRLVLNLVGNAVKFTLRGGEVRLSLTTDDDHAVVEVADTGVGIPADEVGSVFDRFFRASTAHEFAIQGTGLGLAIVSSIVAAHRGRVEVASEPGIGTTFTVALPLAR